MPNGIQSVSVVKMLRKSHRSHAQRSE